jgi:nucleoside-diphosphate kinase
VPPERTLVLLKPDALQRHLVGRVIARLEGKGLHLVAAKLIKMSADQARRHYWEHREKPFFSDLVSFITSSSVLAMVWEGRGAVTVVRKLVGETDPCQAAPGTIRGDWALSVLNNLVHAADSPQAAEREIANFFAPEEILSQCR